MNKSEADEVVMNVVKEKLLIENSVRLRDESLEFYWGFTIRIADSKGHFKPEWDIAVSQAPNDDSTCTIEYKYYSLDPFSGKYKRSNYAKKNIAKMTRDEFSKAIYLLIWNIYTSRNS